MRSAVPVFFSVKGDDVEVPVVKLPNAMLVGVTEICGVARTPVPESATGATALAELLVAVTLPVTAPPVVGANCTLPAAEAPGASVSGSVKPVTLKPAPVTANCETVSVAVPLLRRVSACVLVVPVVTLANAMLVGVMAS